MINTPESFLATAAITFFVLLVGEPIIKWVMRLFGFYAVVEEGTSHVYVLFGRVMRVLNQPGFYLLWFTLGPAALLVRFFGKVHVLDMRLDQKYLRSLPVNSEEGAPMGIGVWYEMFISDPVAYLFQNTDPEGSLSANVSNATVRTLSNMPLGDMLETRHTMSQAVRHEVSPKSAEWGYKLGSVYIRKVHFRDTLMIQQIEEKVVNRLRQVTAAIRQDGANQVDIIAGKAEREAAIEFGKANAMRPQVVGHALKEICADPTIADALFDVLETQNVLEGKAKITLIPEQSDNLMTQLLATQGAQQVDAEMNGGVE